MVNLLPGVERAGELSGGDGMIAIKISDDGTIQTLYDDEIAALLKDAGASEIECERASDVTFDPAIQKWVVSFRPPYDHLIDNTFDRRDEALAWEKYTLTKELGQETL